MEFSTDAGPSTVVCRPQRCELQRADAMSRRIESHALT
jgi:hypothetical protein